VEDWRRYQEEAAAFFRSAGLKATTDVTVRGVRSAHDIDVFVEFERAGMAHSWVVECKAHARAISKDRALLLRQIVDDVGADKGILLAENGFQAGAKEVVQSTNTLVTSLAELRAASSDEILDVALGSLERRVRLALKRVHSLEVRITNRSSRLPSIPAGEWRHDSVISLVGFLSMLESGIRAAQDREFPTAYTWSVDDRVVRASRSEFVPQASALLDELERVVASLTAPT
jgi:restriction system protein